MWTVVKLGHQQNYLQSEVEKTSYFGRTKTVTPIKLLCTVGVGGLPVEEEWTQEQLASELL